MSRFKVFSLFLTLSLVSFGSWLYQTTPGFLRNPPGVEERVVFLDRHGLPIRAYAQGENFDWIDLKDVPKEQVDLLILAEDKDFFSHAGIDFKGTLRSLWVNVKSLKIISGASTIDQQVFRLSHQMPRNFLGKLRTLVGAYKLNRRYSKKEILQHYINGLPYAHKISGLKRAAEVFFGKEVQLLSLSEMAVLAVLPRSPGLLTRTHFQKLLHQKKNQLLDRYRSRDLEFEKKIQVTIRKDYSGWDNYHLVSRLLKRSDFPSQITNGFVHTTLDSYLQTEVSEILNAQLEELKAFRVNHAAVVVVENETGDVLSYVGSQKLEGGVSGYIDALEVKRQPGSTLKPLTYALALLKGKTLGEVLPDIPSYYKTGLGQFLPRNYDQTYSGPRLMREALANSLNLPAVALADELGVEALYDFYKQMGLDLPKGPEHYGVGLTLGNVEITPLNLAEVYTAFANQGKRVELKYFQKEKTITHITPLEPAISFQINDVLKDTIARREEFGENNPFDLPFEFSVKTGTSTDFRDNWSVGYNRKYTIVVWVGNMDQKSMKKVSGITGAGPVLSKVARFLMKDKFLAREEQPSQIERHEICALSGKMASPHCTHKKTELFLKGSFTQTFCDYHQKVVVKDCHVEGDLKEVSLAILPDAYQAFVSTHPEWSVDYQVSRICTYREALAQLKATATSEKVSITRPLPNSIYAIDPHLPQNLQRLKLELNQFHQVKSVRWKKDGKALSGKDSSLDWTMEKGKHAFEAEVEFLDGRVEKTTPLSVTVL